MVGDVGYCVVSADIQEAEPDLGDEWRNWHVDEAPVGIWKKEKEGSEGARGG